jgi:hypothetical protein
MHRCGKAQYCSDECTVRVLDSNLHSRMLLSFTLLILLK